MDSSNRPQEIYLRFSRKWLLQFWLNFGNFWTQFPLMILYQYYLQEIIGTHIMDPNAGWPFYRELSYHCTDRSRSVLSNYQRSIEIKSI
jgi:hypothetical protein